jgi:hypothetical protein
VSPVSPTRRLGGFLSSLLTPLGDLTTKSKPGPPGSEIGMRLTALFFKNEGVTKRRDRCGNVYTYVGTGLRWMGDVELT